MGKLHGWSGRCHITLRAEVWFFHEKLLLLAEESSVACLLPATPLLRVFWGANACSITLLRRHPPSCWLVPVPSLTCLFSSSVFAPGLRGAGDVGPALLLATLLPGFVRGSGVLEEENTPCPVQMKDGEGTYPGLMGARAQPVLFAYLQISKIILLISRPQSTLQRRGINVSSALFSVGGETEAWRKCHELRVSSAVQLSHLVEATSAVALTGLYDFLPKVVCSR